MGAEIEGSTVAARHDEVRGERNDRGERGEGRRGRGQRGGERAPINREAIAAEALALGEVASAQADIEAPGQAEGEARESGRRRRRGGRGRGEREDGQTTTEDRGLNTASGDEPGTAAADDAPRNELGEDGEGASRRRRGRDRDRAAHERGERSESGQDAEGSVAQAPHAAVPTEVAAAPEPVTGTAATALASAPVTSAPTPVAAPAVVAPTPLVAERFVLPIDELQAIAQAAGLSWVNSDAEKIRQVQAAIAAEPKPVHVPRERKPPVVLDEGPLVLVETRKDLSQTPLPFESSVGH